MKREKPVKPTQKDGKTDSYTVTEVGTLLESMDKKIDAIAKGHAGLDKRLEDLEISNQGIKDRLNIVELGNSVINGKVSRLEDACSKLLNDLRGTRQEIKTDITNLKVELKSDIKELGGRLSAVENVR